MINYELSEIALKSQKEGCLLCANEACTKACTNGQEVAKIILSLRFENYNGAAKLANY